MRFSSKFKTKSKQISSKIDNGKCQFMHISIHCCYMNIRRQANRHKQLVPLIQSKGKYSMSLCFMYQNEELSFQ